MNPNRFSFACAVAVLSAAVLSVLVWALLWRPLGVLRIAQWLYLTPSMALGLGVAAFGLLGWSRGASRRRADGAAMILVLLGAGLLIEQLFMWRHGFESLLFGGAAETLLEGPNPGRPSPLASLCLLFLAGALWSGGRPGPRRFGMADVFATAILFPAFTAALGYLYQSPVLIDADGAPPMYLPEVLLLSVLALGVLGMNPHASIAGARDGGVADAAWRKLMPAAVLTPSLLGLAQAMALRAGVLDPVIAVALTSVAGMLVSIALIEWVAGLLAEREAEKEGEFMQRETRAREEGMTDALTGLLNRRGWDVRFQALEEQYKREGGNACVVAIDLDGLKQLNDTQGHAVGDALIRRAGRALESVGRRDDFVARLGGDEFAYLAVDCQPQHAEVVVARLQQALVRASVQASIGHAMRDLAGSLPQAFKEADAAMYADKRARKARKTA
jgi:diguanylate cyclase (GGDEF)-like protein